MSNTSYQSDLSDASDIGHGHRTDGQGGVRLKTGRTDTSPVHCSRTVRADTGQGNPFYDRASQRLIERGHKGGQHTASQTDTLGDEGEALVAFEAELANCNRPGDPFYSSKRWIALRDRRRRENPLCQECEQQGTVTPMYAVDHIKPRVDHPELALSYDNTQSLCETHHNRKTAGERRERQKQSI